MTTVHSTGANPTMSEPIIVPPFAVISAAQVQHTLQGREKQIIDDFFHTLGRYG